MIKWTKKDVIKAFEEAMNPKQKLPSPQGVLSAIRDRFSGRPQEPKV